MEPRKNKYTSLFKIDNIPILPPLMTDEKRQEMLRYKELAEALEVKLKLEAESAKIVVPEKLSNEMIREKPCEDEYLEISNLLQEQAESEVDLICKKDEGQQKRYSLDKLQKSETFIYDMIANTVIIPYKNEPYKTDSNENNTVSSTKPNVFEKKLPSAMKPNWSRSTITRPTKESPLRNQFNSRVPLISVKPPTPESKSTSSQECQSSPTVEKSKNMTPKSSQESPEHISQLANKTSDSIENLYQKDFNGSPDSKHDICKAETDKISTPRRSTTSPSLKTEEFTPTLIRSNSFTLESPSNALLLHLASQWGAFETKESPKNSNEYVPIEGNVKGKTKLTESKTTTAIPKEKVSTPKVERKQSPKINTILITNSSMYKNKKSPYDVKLCGRTKLLKKHKSPVSRTISAISIKHRSKHSCKKGDQEKSHVQTNNSTDTPNIHVFKEMDGAQKILFMELLKKQQEEQRRMQENFEKQQKLLLQELSNSTNSAASDYEDACSRPYENTNLKSPQDSAKYSPDLNKSDDFLLSAKNIKNIPSNKFISNVQNGREFTKFSPRRRLFSDDQISNKCRDRPMTPAKRKEKAATILQAYVRGFLVRRLFKTKHVQKIVQTIRDTLLFVLELHMETRYDNSEQNIRLKARLLQQLSSSYQALHKVCFDISTKERMYIIRKDRLFTAKSSARSPHKQ